MGVGVLKLLDDALERDLYPSKHVIWNGNTFTTNTWGMRDREYSKEKPAGTLRIALLGPSHVVGNGVAGGAPFQTLVEDRLNREFTHSRYRRFEILNFAVDGYTMVQQLRITPFGRQVVRAEASRLEAVLRQARKHKLLPSGGSR